jgi:hypothetical protein
MTSSAQEPHGRNTANPVGSPKTKQVARGRAAMTDRRGRDKADRWVNAVITVVIPLDVPVTATPLEKQDATSDAMDLVTVPPGVVMSARWQDAGRDDD